VLWGTTSSPASDEDEAQQLCDYYLKRKVSGVFFAPLEPTERKSEIHQRISHALDESHIPIVLLDRDIVDCPERSRHDMVGIDNRRAGFVITEHLLNCGARRIGFWCPPHSLPTVNSRYLGYRAALLEHFGTRPDPFVAAADPSDISVVGHFVEQLKPDAIVCANDYTAAQFMTSLSRLGLRIPEDIRVTGIDDIRYASMLQTPLTTIQQPWLDLGATALSAMLDRISHLNTPIRDCLLGFQLIIRQSSGSAQPGAGTTEAIQRAADPV